MATLKALKKRIAAVKKTRQITKAMKMVAAAKLRRAQLNMERAKPYAENLKKVIAQLGAAVPREAHPLLAVRPQKRAMLIVITSDRGLCGAFNVNIAKRAEHYIKENEGGHEEIELAVIGKKGREYFRFHGYDIAREYMEVLTEPTMDKAAEIGLEITGRYIDEGLDAAYVVYNEFKSAAKQEVVVERLLPIIPEEMGVELGDTTVEFLYEPSQSTILSAILPLYVNVRIYFAVLESLAAEMGARMTAMDLATQNAEDMIARLTLQFNRTRQAAITKELLEIVAGAEALKER